MRGFTLTEMIVVIALMGTIASFTALQNINAYTRILAHTDASTVRGALVKARSEAMQSLCSSELCDAPPPHGVLVSEHQALIFEGSSYAGRVPNADEIVPLDGTNAITGMREIVFAPISGEPLEATSLILANNSGAVWQITTESSGAVKSRVLEESTTSSNTY
ncbi:MAG: hypothetical protein JWN90_667 [Parcubacteria group bacterium]|nr:hypothetical protein [Parcubacteria group bacterium]